MSLSFDKYNSIPFIEYFSKKNGNKITIDNLNRLLRVNNINGGLLAVVHFSVNINHNVITEELFNKTIDKKEKIYYVYESGNQGRDWLWHYGNLVSLDDLFN